MGMSYRKNNKHGKAISSLAHVVISVALAFFVSVAWAQDPSAGKTAAKAATEASSAVEKPQVSASKQSSTSQQSDTASSSAVDDASADSLMDADSSVANLDGDTEMPAEEGQGFYKSLKSS